MTNITASLTTPLRPSAFMSVQEFSRYAGLGRSFVYEMFARNEIGTVKIGRRRLIPVENAEAWRRSVTRHLPSNSDQPGGEGN